MRPYAPRGVKELTGACALVTGGAVRLGRAIALELARAGADVAVGYHRSARAARETRRALEAAGVRAVAIRADLGRPADARRLVADAARALGRLDVLVNNAAVFPRTPFLATTPAQFDRVIAVNLRGAFFCAQAFARRAGARGRGRIVNVADVAAVRAWPGYVPYCVSKAGIAMLTRGLAAALAPRIQVNAVAPGVVLPPEGFPPQALARLVRRVPMRRRGDPGDVAAAVRFFASCPDYITGQCLFVDGGATAV
jgi:NAD(P)-dependent dehydrogenase (short-subunit alcohol dehydrogenase family)